MGWITDHPPDDVDLDSCVTCGLCLPVCPTFRLTGDETASPRGRLTAIAAIARGDALLDERFDEITGFCLQCRACETVCPSLVPFSSIIEAARAEAVAQVPRRGQKMRRYLLGSAVGSPLAMRIATIEAAILQRIGILQALPVVGGASAGLRPLPLPVPSARGGAWGDPSAERVVLFTGCIADTWFSDIHKATIEVLLAAGYRVEAPDAQTCCGALASHAGFGDEAEVLARRNIAALSDAPSIVANVAGCGAHLKAYARFGADGASIAGRTVDVTEIVAAAIADGRLPSFPFRGEKVAVQDPCHLEHGQGIVDEPRAIVRAAGFEVVDADLGGLCCGAAGVYQLDHPDIACALGEAKAEQVAQTGASLVASANAGCEMQLRRYLDAGFTVLHPVEIYAKQLARRDPAKP